MGFDHVIPELIKKIFKASNGKRQTGEKIEIEIEGDGSETRSFVYIDDTIDAINLCTNTGEKNNIFNIGTEEEKSIKNLVISIGGILGLEVSIKSSTVRRGSTPRRCPDTSKLRFLGFIQKTSFEQGLKKTVDWYWDYYLQYLND